MWIAAEASAKCTRSGKVNCDSIPAECRAQHTSEASRLFDKATTKRLRRRGWAHNAMEAAARLHLSKQTNVMRSPRDNFMTRSAADCAFIETPFSPSSQVGHSSRTPNSTTISTSSLPDNVQPNSNRTTTRIKAKPQTLPSLERHLLKNIPRTISSIISLHNLPCRNIGDQSLAH